MDSCLKLGPEFIEVFPQIVAVLHFGKNSWHILGWKNVLAVMDQNVRGVTSLLSAFVLIFDLDGLGYVFVDVDVEAQDVHQIAFESRLKTSATWHCARHATGADGYFPYGEMLMVSHSQIFLYGLSDCRK